VNEHGCDGNQVTVFRPGRDIRQHLLLTTSLLDSHRVVQRGVVAIVGPHANDLGDGKEECWQKGMGEAKNSARRHLEHTSVCDEVFRLSTTLAWSATIRWRYSAHTGGLARRVILRIGRCMVLRICSAS
jgi:hypothetical protein